MDPAQRSDGRSFGGSGAAGPTAFNTACKAVRLVIAPPVARKKPVPANPASMLSFDSHSAPDAVKRAFGNGVHSPFAGRTHPFWKRAR